MGLMDFISSTIQSAADSVKEGDITDLMNGGLIGNKLMRDSMLLAQELESRPKPGKLCHKLCPLNDMRCEACLAEQQNILDALENLENLEQIVNNSNTTEVQPLPDKCPLCSAPLENGAKQCPYCGTAYPKICAAADIPATEFERDSLLLKKSAEAFALYSALYKKQIGYKMENNNLPPIVRGMMKSSRTIEENNMVMTADQIRQGAQSNGISYLAYISGIMSGKYKSISQINTEMRTAELKRRSAELTRQSQEQNAQMLAQQQARLQRARQEDAQRQLERARNSAPLYVGGPGPNSTGSCCGNCRYYMVFDNKCAYNEHRHPTGANDYCNSYRSK